VRATCWSPNSAPAEGVSGVPMTIVSFRVFACVDVCVHAPTEKASKKKTPHQSRVAVRRL